MFTIRYALDDDAAKLRRLAVLDSQAVPPGPLLVAEVAGEIWAAVEIAGPGQLGDPFRHTSDLIALLRVRAEQLCGTQRPARAVLLPYGWSTTDGRLPGR
jgi:hypothetical protein